MTVNPGPASSINSNPIGVIYDPVAAQLSANGAVLGKFAACAIPFIIAPTGSMANNGAITLGTSLPTTYANAYIYLPANAIQTGSSAGWYFCQMSSATVGTVFNNTYTPGLPTIPANPTAFASTGPGAYTGVTTAVTGPQITIPAGALGPNGALRINHLWAAPANTDTKTISLSVGGSILWSATLNTAVQAAAAALNHVWNRGAQNSNVSVNSSGASGLGISAFANNYTSINFGAAQTISLGGQLATATDFIVMESFLVELMP
jgi:hypothetical protein